MVVGLFVCGLNIEDCSCSMESKKSVNVLPLAGPVSVDVEAAGGGVFCCCLDGAATVARNDVNVRGCETADEA